MTPDGTVKARIIGQPRPQGSMQPHRGGMHHPRTTLQHRDWLVSELRRQQPQPPRLDGPLSVRFEFVLRRPASHYTSRGRLSARATAYPSVPPDIDKLERLANDALTLAGWITDDARIVESSARKRWAAIGEPGSTTISVGRYVDPPQ